MLTEIGPKKFVIGGRIILQVILAMPLLYIIYMSIFQKSIHHLNKMAIRDWAYIIIFLIMNILAFLQLLFLPFWVTIDDELKTLEIKYLMLHSKIVNIYDIIAYSSTTIKSRSSSCFGMFLYLTGGKQVLLSDLTLDNYTPVEVFLKNLKVENKGEEGFSFLSYFMHQ